MSRKNPRRKRRRTIIPDAEVVYIPETKKSRAGVKYTHYKKGLKTIDKRKYIQEHQIRNPLL